MDASMGGTVMVALDGSGFAETALGPATDLARRTGAGLHLVSVRERGPGWASQGWPLDQVDGWRAEYLARVADSVGEEGITVTTALPEGDVTDALLRQTTAAEAGLVVLSSHGRGRVSGAWLGEVAVSLLHRARVPLLVLRPPEDDGEADEEAREDAAGAWTRPRRIVVALDGTPDGEVVVEPALRLARAWDASLHLVRVAPFPRALTSPYIPHAVEFNREIVDRGETEARAYLDEALGRLVPDDVPATRAVVVTAQAARGILAEAADAGADMVALATHHGTLHRLALGSTADKVVRASTLPVLVARPAD